MNRSSFLQLAGAALLARPAFAQTGARMHTRKIPSTGELLPVVGCGTWQTFDVGSTPAERSPRAEVLKVLFEAGGSVIDSSPMYGRAEEVVGDLLAEAGSRDKAFLATKVWTSGAHVNDWFIVLARTSDEADRHEGLSQLLVDLRSNDLRVNPIPFLDGTTHFNEVLLTEVFVPDELVLGEVGMGWAQNTSELAYERGGPDRWLSTYLVLEHFLRERAGRATSEQAAALLGEATARWWALRQLSLSVARQMDRGEAPAAESALVKEMGTRFEQDVLNGVQQLVDLEPSLESSSVFEQLLARAILTAPSFTIRGGTNEILRSVAARGLRRP